MPIDYDYDAERGLLTCEVGEELVVSELVEYLRAARTDDRLEPGTIELVSLDRVREFAIRAEDIRDVEPELREYVENVNIQGSIFHGATPLQAGVARMLSGMLTTMFPDYPAPVVRSRKDALEYAAKMRDGSLEDPLITGEGR